MKVVIAKGGAVQTVDMEAPAVKPNHVLIETRYSAISAGTEMMMIGKNGPDRVLPLGYSSMGTVVEVGSGVDHVRPGQRVACYGAPYVRHAELLSVPRNLVVPLDDSIDSGEAAFAGLGAIAIHALRQADIRFGETVAVVGLGILGQMICQIADAGACSVIGFDLLPERKAKLEEQGISRVYADERDVLDAIMSASGGAGADVVVLCAGGANPGLIDKALTWVRDRGKVLVVGDIRMEFDRELMFAKEAQVLISRAGGPGRYDESYESGGNDYPISFVRWTEGRNMAEYIRLLGEKRLRMGPLITHSFPVSRAQDGYAILQNSPQTALGILLDFGKDTSVQ